MYRCGIETLRESSETPRSSSINCTVVELKHKMPMTESKKKMVLIVPLWNWNTRTDEEIQYNVNVLIVPLWNWNVLCCIAVVVPSAVLIVPLWNWNNGSSAVADCEISINCTVVELKHQWRGTDYLHRKSINCTVVELKRWSECSVGSRFATVLIVPLWNWNTLLVLLDVQSVWY